MIGQREVPKKSGELKLENYKIPSINEKPKVEEPKATLGYKSILTKKEDTYLKKFTFKKEEKVQPIMVQKEKGYDFDEDRKQKLNIKLDSEKEGSKVDLNYGKYIVETERIKILLRDFGEEDGDLIRLFKDEFIVQNSIYLSNFTKEIIINLSLGDNFLEFLALNEGFSSPNTASFSVVDANGKIIFSNEWNLNTGVSANFNLYYKIPSEEKSFEELEKENNKTKSENSDKK
tara:strand:- start:146832 stop:147527 length:696 start_codon:yes stop_codon:yes gene_type:complete